MAGLHPATPTSKHTKYYGIIAVTVPIPTPRPSYGFTYGPDIYQSHVYKYGTDVQIYPAHIYKPGGYLDKTMSYLHIRGR